MHNDYDQRAANITGLSSFSGGCDSDNLCVMKASVVCITWTTRRPISTHCDLFEEVIYGGGPLAIALSELGKVVSSLAYCK